METEKKNPSPQISYILVERKKQTKYVKYIICLTVLILRNRGENKMQRGEVTVFDSIVKIRTCLECVPKTTGRN